MMSAIGRAQDALTDAAVASLEERMALDRAAFLEFAQQRGLAAAPFAVTFTSGGAAEGASAERVQRGHVPDAERMHSGGRTDA